MTLLEAILYGLAGGVVGTALAFVIPIRKIFKILIKRKQDELDKQDK